MPEGARAPERLLIYGGPGVGKSSCWIDIAQKMEEYRSPGKVYVLDTDNAVEAMFGAGYAHLEERVVWFPCYDWPSLTKAQKEVMETRPTIDDWVVIDMMSFPYTEIRRYYTEMVYGQNLEEYLLETARLINMAKAAKEAGDKSSRSEREFGDWSGRDWDHMNKIYLAWEVPLTLRMPANVVAVAEEREVDSARGASADQVKRYKRAGSHKPYVNKTAEHRFRTVIRVTNPGSSRELVLAKDRYREEVWDETASRGIIDLGDMHEDGGFVRRYLVDIAGWRLRRRG